MSNGPGVSYPAAEIYANVLCEADRYWSRAMTDVKQQATTSLILAVGNPCLRFE
jgi:hypothetical protein